MSRKILYIFLFFAAWVAPVSSQDNLRMSDIPRVMERLFHFHIENKQFNPSLIRRSVKLYIEQFDSEKAYLLESEVHPYLNMSDSQAAEMMLRIQNKNYSDFLELNALMNKAILRAQKLRQSVVEQLVSENRESDFALTGYARYPQSELEIAERQKNRLLRFYQFHQSRSHLESSDRKLSVFGLFEKKVRRAENNYLFFDRDGLRMTKEKIEHLISLRILKSFAKSLDTHTAFFSPEEAYEMRLSLEKQFDGVGVVLSEGIDGVMIADLIEGSPAQQSGLIQVNDLLVEVDGTSTSAASFEEVLDLLKKRDRSEIVLGFKRFDPAEKKEMFFRVSLKKRPIAMKDDRIKTSYEVVDGGIIGKITLHSFYESSDGISSEKDIK